MDALDWLLFVLGLVVLAVVVYRLAHMALPYPDAPWQVTLTWKAEALGLVSTGLGGLCAMLGLHSHAAPMTGGGLLLLYAALSWGRG